MLTDKEYRLMKRIQRAGGKLNAMHIMPWERKTLRDLLAKGYVGFEPDSKEEEKKLENGEVVFDEHTSEKADAAEKCAKPELNPRSVRIFTPADFFCILGRFTFFFGLGVLSRFFMKLIFKF